MEIFHWSEADFTHKEVCIRPMLQNNSTRELQITIPKEAVLKEHQAPYEFSIQVLSGEIWFAIDEKKEILKPLDMVCLEAYRTHSVGAIEDSIVRVSLSQNDTLSRIYSIISQG
ncbi:hypothetical protein B6S12_00950 [Helicobacter valdiviensis]|uniref:Cupin n=1 Tax=Helicobacter valdiviensis TaxID=1458358 RepID=A0A2W6MWL8_9HELI|nr:cupin domain-containing protein [Helicobacter valdiviensis]PZT48894.1 hypothetical protein B6S12_00950 [Helicobacter valdiviensis]